MAHVFFGTSLVFLVLWNLPGQGLSQTAERGGALNCMGVWSQRDRYRGLTQNSKRFSSMCYILH